MQPKLATNLHVHLFTADHTPEIQFFYMLWNVFEDILVRKGVGVGPIRKRFELEEVACYEPCLRFSLWAAELLGVNGLLEGPVRGLIRTVEVMTHAGENDIRRVLGVKTARVGHDALVELRRRLGEQRGEMYPFDAALAGIARDLYQLHRASQGGSYHVDQKKLLQTFFGRGQNEGRAEYQRLIILTVNFDHAFQEVYKYGLEVNPEADFEQQVTEIAKLATDSNPLGDPDKGLPAVEIWPFLCVDPRHNPPEGLARWVQERVSNRGPFRGIKVYPPMGFSPAHPKLRQIFLWCKRQSIPVTTHCSIGGGGLRGLEERGRYAHPYQWRPVLDWLAADAQPGVFRLNLAHFSDLSRSLDREADRTWSDEIMKMMLRYNRGGKVEIYSDIAYACVEPKDLPAFEANVKKLSQLNPPIDLAPWEKDIDLGPWQGKFDLRPWLLFGSDWWNYLPSCSDEEAYTRNIELERLFDVGQLNANADRFLA